MVRWCGDGEDVMCGDGVEWARMYKLVSKLCAQPNMLYINSFAAKAN